MKNLISSAINGIASLFNSLQVKRFFAVALVGVVVLTTSIGAVHSNNTLPDRVDKELHEIDSVRPKTVGEWNQEARETSDSPGERIKNIAEESAQAFKEFGSLYPDTADTTNRALQESTNR